MGKLVIVESPAKAHTVGRILGPEYTVKASVGHVCDLPDHALGIAISEDGRRFTPEYVVPDDKKRTVADLVKAAKAADEVLLASDPDREGEAIAWHVRNQVAAGLGKAAATKPFRRVEYNEITPSAVRAAVAAPHEIDMHRVDAQQARRLLDRLVGWKISPSLRRARGIPRTSVGSSLSAGRVQSVALRLVCDREREVRAFVPVPYWDFSVELRKKDAPEAGSFRAQVVRFDGAKPEVHDEAAAAAAEKFLAGAAYRVSNVSRGEKKRNPGAPFTTSTLQQRASTVLGFAPDLTMRLAQDLYEHSLITYMRTDSRAVSKEAQAAAGAFVAETWGPEFANPHTYGNKAGAQAAHECIRPTDPRTTPENAGAALEGVRDPERAAKLYGLVWRQFVTSQMAPAVYETVSAEIEASPGPDAPGGAPRSATLAASTARLTFPGFLRADPERMKGDVYDPQKTVSAEEAEDAGGEEHDSSAVASLPPLEDGEALDSSAPLSRRKETKPRPRFNEASLVRELERNGIGRPSTFAATIATLKNRRYVESRSRILTPTDLGFAVADYLVARFPELLDVAFTAKMETKLDEVEDPEKALDWQEMLADFNARLKRWLKEARGPAVPAEELRAVLSEFRKIRVWAAPRKTGKRVYDDRAFVQDVANDFMGVQRRRQGAASRRAAGDPAENGAVPASPPPNAAGYAFDPSLPPAAEFTERQMEALLRILSGYRDQIPDLDAFFSSIGRPEAADGAASGAAAPKDPRLGRIFGLVEAAGVSDRAKPFFESLRAQYDAGRSLSPRQVKVLEDMLVEAAPSVPGWSPELCEELGVAWREPASQDPELAGDLVSALGRVTQWAEPVKRGARTFDDRAFYVSVASQFGTRNGLSYKQIAALQRMFLRYFDQIPDAAEIAAKHGLEKSASRKSRRFTAKKPEA